MDCWWGRVSSTTAAKRCGCRVSQDIHGKVDPIYSFHYNETISFFSTCLGITLFNNCNSSKNNQVLQKIQGIVDAILLLPMYCLFLTVLIINFHTYSYRSYAHTISPCWYKLFKTCNTILMSSYLDQVQ